MDGSAIHGEDAHDLPKAAGDGTCFDGDGRLEQQHPAAERAGAAETRLGVTAGGGGGGGGEGEGTTNTSNTTTRAVAGAGMNANGCAVAGSTTAGDAGAGAGSGCVVDMDAGVVDADVVRAAMEAAAAAADGEVEATAAAARDALDLQKRALTTVVVTCIGDLDTFAQIIHYKAQVCAQRARVGDVLAGVAGAVIAVASGTAGILRDHVTSAAQPPAAEPAAVVAVVVGMEFTTAAAWAGADAVSSATETNESVAFVTNMIVMTLGVGITFTVTIAQLFAWTATATTLTSVYASAITCKAALNRVVMDIKMATSNASLALARKSFATREYDMYAAVRADIDKWCTSNDFANMLPAVLADAKRTQVVLHEFRAFLRNIRHQ